MTNSLLISTLSPKIESTFRNKENKNTFIKSIQKYVDKNNQILYHNAPSYRLYFSDKYEREPIYKLVGIEKESIVNNLKELKHLDSKWKISNEPFNVLMTLIIRDFTIRKDKDGINNALLFLSLSLYSSLQYKYFKYPPNENIMQYTINNVSNKYLFKQYGVVIKAIYHTAITSHETYYKDLIKGDDKNITDYFINLRSRLNNLIRNFAGEYHHNHKEGNYLNTQQDSNDEENYYETENLSGLITQLSEKVSIKFFSTSINQKILRIAAKMANCDTPTLNNAIHNIKENESSKVRDLIRLILQVYLNDSKNSYDTIATQKFIAYSISVYSRSNTKDEAIIQIKDLLDYFLNKNSERYMNTEREATKNNYRKGLYTYFTLLISDTQTIK